MKVKLRLTVVIDYEADSDHYSTSIPSKMVEYDAEEIRNGELDVVEFMDSAIDCTITGEVLDA